ncbi:Trichothecene 8-O-acetyltransferase-like protein [Cladobotryum mycophilum]|uniref:Trichothecene 8-O-acetyltransferase-like protein n=1 Tax=Cladobotryum mycophilum TaxID=491253 RepID=A0ABR0SHN0_9HYPO
MERRLLSTWNQVAPRAYICKWYCFPYDREGNLEDLREHLIAALHQLAKHFPDLAAKVFLLSNPLGCLCIELDDHAEIPLKVFNAHDSFGWTYDELKSQGFPARAFVDTSFDLPYRLQEDKQGIPVFEVHARLIEGGLLLGIYSHHSISDGTGLDNYISSFAELTRDPNQTLKLQCPADIDIDLPETIENARLMNVGNRTFQELLELCPEYSLLPSPTGPTQFRALPTGLPIENIQKTGRIFVVGAQKITTIREKVLEHLGTESSERLPSTFTCLAGIIWAHVTKARLRSPKNLLSSSTDKLIAPERVRLMICINWRRRAFTSIMDASAGNTIALPVATVDIATLLAVSDGDENVAYKALAVVAQAIDTTISSVNEDFVALRTSTIRAAPDPRLIGLTADLRDPQDFYINTWRHFGADTRDGIIPDAVRKAQAGWDMGAALVLPAKKNSLNIEVLVRLDIDSMATLCSDSRWGDWVDKVIE